MSNWYDPDHLSDGKVRDISVHEEHPDDWDCEIELNCHKTENSGRVSTVFMRYLRDKYGENTADRALKRAQKESSVREKKTCQPYQQKRQAFSR